MAAQVLYEATDFPIFQNRMYDTADEAIGCPRGQITLVEHPDTGLVYNSSFEPGLMTYDPAYQNEQALSTAFRQHLEWAADLVRDRMGDQLIEVGCGKGTFLSMLSDRGVTITGFDPTYEGDDPRIELAYFGPATAMSADGLVLRHVLEHVENPVAFLSRLAAANGGGLIYIEVPCFDWICDNRAWFDVFYEHVNYFRLADLRAMFSTVIDAGHCFGGQYLYLIADLATLRAPIPRDPVNFPADFTASLNTDISDQDVVWGGASKGVIYALLRERLGPPVAHVLDINPAKQHKFLAATGIRVEAPEDVIPHLPDETRIIVMNPNYAHEIRAEAGERFRYSII